MERKREILHDVKYNKKIKWKEHKLDIEPVYKSYLRNYDITNNKYYLNKAIKLKQCAETLTFKEYEDGSKKLYQSYFCKVRLCPMCAWRRSLKIFGQVSKIMDYIEEKYNYKYLFLTFTTKNVYGKDLINELDKLFKSFDKLMKRKELKNMCKGFFRTLEITYNWKKDNYHPHIHLIIAVKKNYFKKEKLYLSQDKFTNLWKSCLKIDYTPIVDVRVVKQNNNSYKKAIAEIAKYTVKLNDYILHPKNINDIELIKLQELKTDEVIRILDVALQNRRLVAFGGEFKIVHKKLNLDDSENGNLVNIDNENDLRDDLNYIICSYKWNVGFQNYFKIEED